MTSSPPHIASDEQHLCVSCGMCCDGTLFDYVETLEEERVPLSALFTLRPGPKGPVFDQPCPHNRDRCCTIYQNRPATCRKYRCKTLLALESGEVGGAEAARRVTEAILARDGVAKMLEPDETLSAARERRAALAGDPSRSPGALVFVLKLTALDLLLDRYFRKPGRTMLNLSEQPQQLS